MKFWRFVSAALGAAAAVVPAVSSAQVVPVGSGPDTADLVVQFNNTDKVTFQTSWDSSSGFVGGSNLADAMIEYVSNQTGGDFNNDIVPPPSPPFGTTAALDVWYATHPMFGMFVNDVGYNNFTPVNNGEAWWHLWTRDSINSPWTSSGVGLSFVGVSDGIGIGLRYGDGAAPGSVAAGSAVAVSTGDSAINFMDANRDALGAVQLVNVGSAPGTLELRELTPADLTGKPLDKQIRSGVFVDGSGLNLGGGTAGVTIFADDLSGLNGSSLEVLHWDGTAWEQVTIDDYYIDPFGGGGWVRTATELTSFSPIVIVPEPASVVLLGLGAVLALRRQRQR